MYRVQMQSASSSQSPQKRFCLGIGGLQVTQRHDLGSINDENDSPIPLHVGNAQACYLKYLSKLPEQLDDAGTPRPE